METQSATLQLIASCFFDLVQGRMIIGKVQEVYAACKVFTHDVVRDLSFCFSYLSCLTLLLFTFLQHWNALFGSLRLNDHALFHPQVEKLVKRTKITALFSVMNNKRESQHCLATFI